MCLRHAVTLQGGMRRTALHWACQKGDLQSVEALVAAGANAKVGQRSTAYVYEKAGSNVHKL